MGNRLEVTERSATETGIRLAKTARAVLGTKLSGVESIQVSALYLLDRVLSPQEAALLSKSLIDPATQTAEWSTVQPAAVLPPGVAEVVLRAGVTDPVGAALEQAAGLVGLAPMLVRSGYRYRISASTPADLDAGLYAVDALLRNDIVDELFTKTAAQARFATAPDDTTVETVAVRILDAHSLAALSRARGLALDPEELLAVQAYFQSIDRDPTDAELETIAQTWSEHCSHKTFRAAITWDDGTPVEPLLKQLRNSTDLIAAPFVRSAFVDNAGIIAFDDQFDVAIKVETHNHPSAVEPFGGANTGVGGVIRDVLGVAADPIATTDILCFGPLDTPADTLPAGVLHPFRVRQGVVAGVADYGNKLGLPTVAGAVVHHDGFTANPLVFCGCIGLRPAGLVLEGQKPGHRIVAIGGATGRDGIRGATFSSTTMDATTGDVAGASVQIGDPIVEKLVADVLVVAREQRLFSAITDCGAGGFSSAIGELAAELGANVDLDLAPRKYAGLAPWEVWLSEAQERMVLAVPAQNVPALLNVCADHGVEMCDLGAFRDDGQLIVSCAGSTIVNLPGSFLHDGRPQRRMTASHPATTAATGVRDEAAILAGASEMLLAVLAHSDVRSNEDIVRGYDHEIMGATIGRPFQGAADDGPGDAAVLAPVRSTSGRGLTIGIGVGYRSGDIDAYRMAGATIDEAIRNAVCVGADPDQIALLDNFSWGDPRRPETLGRLVEAVRGCVDGAAHFNAPFVSGKDSLNNEYETEDGTRRSIPQTLVITALAIVPDALKLVSSDAKHAGNMLVLVGGHGTDLRGSILDSLLGLDGPGTVPGASNGAAQRYRSVHQAMRMGLVRAAHDVSDGGLVSCVAEMSIGGRLGAQLNLEAHASSAGVVATLFGETSGRIVLEVEPSDCAQLLEITGGEVIGSLQQQLRFQVTVAGDTHINLGTDQLLHAWRGHVSRGNAAEVGEVA